MQDQYQRHADRKDHMLCLVPEYIHTGDTAYAAADDCEQKQRGFGDTPCMLYGFLLIYSHK